MITHFASGGLGNQLFNYAAARSLADRRDTDLLIDVESYRDQWHAGAARPFLLQHFPVRAQFRNFGPSRTKPPLWRRVMRRLHQDVATKKVRRDGLGYFPEFDALPSRTILHDHYISPRFFDGNAQAIRDDLRLPASVLDGDAGALVLLAAIERAREPVFVHVRRGDLLNPENRLLYFPEMERYYFKAMRLMAEQCGGASFFVFSDDPSWCREQFRELPHSITYAGDADAPAAHPLRDFYLMTRCKGAIIANSAFSWWAAWLDPHANKKVLAPQIWDQGHLIDMEDLIPTGWTRVEWRCDEAPA